MFVGLRGVGKSVLLNEVQAMAEKEGALTDFIEISTNEPLSKTILIGQSLSYQIWRMLDDATIDS